MINFFAVMAFISGLILGSFINCLLWRWHENESISGRSYCPRCRHKISWYDNIPVLSFILLKGRCRHCRQKISWQYPLVELATAILFLLVFLHDSYWPDFSWFLMRDWLMVVVLVSVFVYDWRWQLVPVGYVRIMSVIFFALNLILGFSWISLLVSGAGMAAFFWLQYILTKKKGLGEGDIWLGLMLGLGFPGWPRLFLILLLAYSAGSIIGLALMSAKRKNWKSKIAFGPFLAFGAIITLIWGEKIIGWYLGFFS